MEKLDIRLIKGILFAHIDFWSIRDNDYFTMLFLIDTGAEATTFSHYALEMLGYSIDVNKPVTVRTGGGITTAYEVAIPKIKIGDIELTDITANSNKYLDDFEMDGIIGMNVLMQFNFCVNFDENIMLLERRGIN